MKTLLCLAAVLVAAPVYACDGALGLNGGCYSQNLRQRIVVEKVVQPEYVEVERIVVPQKIVRERIVERQKIVRQRQPILQLNLGQRQKVVKRERVVVERVRSY